MKQKTVNCTSEFNFPWKICSLGYLLRYTVGLTPHVISSDILDAYLDGGKLVVICLTVKKNDITKYKWAKYFDRIFIKGEVLEKHVVDLDEKKHITASINFNARCYMKCNEIVEITPAVGGGSRSTLFREFSIQSLLFTDSFASQYIKRMKRHDLLYQSIFSIFQTR